MNEIKKHSIVRICEGAKSYSGKHIIDLFYGINCYVMAASGDVVTIGIDGHEIATVKKSDLILVKV